MAVLIQPLLFGFLRELSEEAVEPLAASQPEPLPQRLRALGDEHRRDHEHKLREQRAARAAVRALGAWDVREMRDVRRLGTLGWVRRHTAAECVNPLQWLCDARGLTLQVVAQPMPNSARYTPSPADLDAIREAQRLIGNEELAERAYTSVSSIQRTLRGDGGYDAVRALLVRVAREVVAEEAAKAQPDTAKAA